MDRVDVVSWNPALADQTFLRNVHVEHVHDVINRLHFVHHDDPLGQILGDGDQNSLSLVLRLIDDHVQIFQAHLNTFQHVRTFVIVVGARIQAGVIALANFLDAALQLLALEEGDEDVFVDIFVLK